VTRVAIIPARGGSKRIPGKNIVPFFGHPMIAYGISAALNSRLFESVAVSTDDPLTGKIARWYGALHIERPSRLATDEAGLTDMAIHALDALVERGVRAGEMCLLLPNCPLRRSSDIIRHYDLFRREKRAFQISTVEYRGVYPHWALAEDDTGAGRWYFGEKYLVRSQELGRVSCPTGAIWWTDVTEFREQRAFYGKPFHLAPIDANRGIDIDTEEELSLAELLVRGLKSRDGRSPLEPVLEAPFSARIA
jgi:CMP-N-acetylneuraminic acid synthetase